MATISVFTLRSFAMNPDKKHERVFHSLDIDELALSNDLYRKVLFSKPDSQLALQTLMPGEDIPFEMHSDAKQSFKFVEGEGEVVVINGILDHGKRSYKVKKDSYVIVPSGIYHYVRNTSKTQPLRLYADYSAPVHDPNEVEERQGKIYKIGKSTNLSRSCSLSPATSRVSSRSGSQIMFIEGCESSGCSHESIAIGKVEVGNESESGDQGSFLFALRYEDDNEWGVVDQEGISHCEHRFKDLSGFTGGKCPDCN
jgi:mannose-6-phosphate isomerase-like protein (cupin superfamily)